MSQDEAGAVTDTINMPTSFFGTLNARSLYCAFASEPDASPD